MTHSKAIWDNDKRYSLYFDFVPHKTEWVVEYEIETSEGKSIKYTHHTDKKYSNKVDFVLNFLATVENYISQNAVKIYTNQ